MHEIVSTGWLTGGLYRICWGHSCVPIFGFLLIVILRVDRHFHCAHMRTLLLCVMKGLRIKEKLVSIVLKFFFEKVLWYTINKEYLLIVYFFILE